MKRIRIVNHRTTDKYSISAAGIRDCEVMRMNKRESTIRVFISS